MEIAFIWWTLVKPTLVGTVLPKNYVPLVWDMCQNKLIQESVCVWSVGVAYPHHLDTDPDPASQFDADPDPACQFNADLDPTFHFDADAYPDPSFQIKAQNLEVLK